MSYEDIAGHLAIVFPDREPRTEQAIKDAFRRNEKVRRFYLGSLPDALDKLDVKTLNEENCYKIGTVRANRPRNKEEMAELFDIDTDVYDAEKVVTNQWGKNWQTKIWWRLNFANSLAATLKWDEFIVKIKAASQRFLIPIAKTFGLLRRLAVIEIVDPHHGALSWAPETGTHWDTKLSISEHRCAHYHFLDKINAEETEKILLRLGDDIFHFDKLLDGKAGTTQAGTVQDIDTRWQKLFMEVCELCVELITATVNRVPDVDVIIIPGNHDYQTSFYLGQFLEAYFQNDERISFDTTPRMRKYYRWGCVLLGMTHQPGKRLGINSLADKIREEARKDWGECNYVEFHMGDEHHEEVIDKTGTGVVIRKLRGLVPNDSWHHDEGFSSHRGAQMFIYDKVTGLEEIHYYRTSRQAPYLSDVDLGPTLGEE